MNTIYDTINAQRKLVALSEMSGVTIPDYVSQYTPLTKESASKIDDDLYADPDNREYPLFDKASCWLSAAMYQLDRCTGELQKTAYTNMVWDAIKQAATVYGIDADVKETAEAVDAYYNAPVKAASDDDYCWLVKDAYGQIINRRYPVFDSEGVKKASEYFAEHRMQYPIEVRREIAGNIMRKAAQYSYDTGRLPDAVIKEAGYGLPQTELILDEMLERAHMAKDAEAAMALLNVSELIGGLNSLDVAGMLDKVAEVIEEFDKTAGLADSYGVRVTCPADFLYAVPIKEAEDALSNIVVLANTAFDKRALAELDPEEAFTPVLGTAVTEKFAAADGVDADAMSGVLQGLSSKDQYAVLEHLQTLYA